MCPCSQAIGGLGVEFGNESTTSPTLQRIGSLFIYISYLYNFSDMIKSMLIVYFIIEVNSVIVILYNMI